MTSVSPVPRVGIVFRPQLPPERLAGFVAAAEQAGLDDLWLWEDCFLEGGLTSAAAALAWSSSLRVGLGLMPAPLRNPALAAMEIATLARLFPGRFVPALGHGVLDWMAQVGARAASPMGLLREWTSAVRSLLHGDTVTVAGTYVKLNGVALDWPPARAVPAPDRRPRAEDHGPGGRAGRRPRPRRRHLARQRPPGHRPGRGRGAARHRRVPAVRGRAGQRRADPGRAPGVSAADPDLAAVGSPADVAATIRRSRRGGDHGRLAARR